MPGPIHFPLLVGPGKSSYPGFSFNKCESPRLSTSARCRKCGEPRQGPEGRSSEERPHNQEEEKARVESWAVCQVPGVLGWACPLYSWEEPSQAGVLRAAKVTDLRGHGLPWEWELEWCPITECSLYGEALTGRWGGGKLWGTWEGEKGETGLGEGRP